MPQRSRWSIAARLTALTVLVSGVALLVATVVFGVSDRVSIRARLARNLSIQAQIVGANSVSALVFNDPQSAGVTLEALRAAPNVVGAAIYALDGTTFATYMRQPIGHVPTRPEAGPDLEETRAFDASGLTLSRPILFQNKRIGSVTIASDMQDLATRQAEYIRTVGFVLLLSLVAALALSWFAQRSISTPIAALAEIAHDISLDKDYARRADITPNTRETTTLVRSFNEMLDQIEHRDRSLRAAHAELDERVRVRTAELDLANRELEAFSYSVSHDLRAPLRHVTGFAELLEERAGPALDDQGRKYLRTITAASRRMAQLIDDLLAFSRMGRASFTKRRVNLGDLVADARHEVMAHAPAGRQIDWHVAPLPDVHADAAMLRLVVLNLLSNAVKYSSTRGVAHIDVGATNGDKKEVVIHVKDDGVGFDMRYVDKLFGVFQRLHTAKEFEGTGIGLANVKRIVHRHGGRVWATGEVDRGATFFFSLPLSEDTHDRSTSQDSAR